MIKSHKKIRKIALITGTRAEFSYYHPIIEEIKKRSSLDYGIIVTNTHLLDSFGRTIDEIKKDKFKIDAEIYNTLDGYNRVTMTKSLSILMLQLPEIFERMEADMVLIAGDRGEQLMAAIVGAHLYLPVAHIQAGELSGNIDGIARHAITKFSHIHFAANQDAADRVLRLGEEKQRVHMVGAPQLDDLINAPVTSPEKIYKKFGLKKKEPNLLLMFHSVTEEYEKMEEYMDNVMAAITEFGFYTVLITNNSDAGSTIIRRKINEYRRPFIHVTDNVPRPDYAGLMNTVDLLVGNSSSGILEAPTFKLAAVNIGNREAGRLQGSNVINTDYSKEGIKRGIKKALSKDFKNKLAHCVNPYGNGHSAKRIVDILQSVVIDDALLIKKLTY